MIGFEIKINGNKICVAGGSDMGIVTAILTWVKRQGNGERQEQETKKELDELIIQVGGIRYPDDKSQQDVNWINQQFFSVGDEISIDIVDTSEFDEPSRQGEIEEILPQECSFCGKDQAEVAQLIAGPGRFICNECTALFFNVITDPTQAGQLSVIFEEQENAKCNFCGKKRSDISTLIKGLHAYICNECVTLCNQVIIEASASKTAAS
jgi:hypothetical protein